MAYYVIREKRLTHKVAPWIVMSRPIQDKGEAQNECDYHKSIGNIGKNDYFVVYKEES